MSQFDTKFTKMTPIDSPVDSKLSESANLNFQVLKIASLFIASWPINNYIYPFWYDVPLLYMMI